jgi:hypothetical protein
MQRITPSRFGKLSKLVVPLLILFSALFFVQIQTQNTRAFLKIGSPPTEQGTLVNNAPPTVAAKANPSIDILNLASQPQPINGMTFTLH